MAQRTVFFVDQQNNYQKAEIAFKWYPGFATSQAQKSIQALHTAFLKQHPHLQMMEISSASPNELGQSASAFNLKVRTTRGTYTVEQLFQAGKVFKKHGNQNRLLECSSKEAKQKIKRINKVDKLVGFEEFGQKFPLEPKTFFYNWMYLKALHQNKQLAKEVLEYDAFTDIYFNSKKAINCQAEACSIYVALSRQNKLTAALHDRESFKSIVYGNSPTDSADKGKAEKEPTEQLSLF